MPQAQMSAAQQLQQAANQNMNVRNLILRTSVFMKQQIFSQGVAPATQNILNIPVNPVGLITGFLIKVAGTIRNTDGALDATRTNFGASNILSQIVFTDLTNTVRVNTSGWHLSLIDSAKGPLVFGLCS
jgi:hypothetical protein